ncbi:GWxTD domain-containing protein [Catalinimonas niigatensis]|uniref:GWxTD domain-containing protein n=1 Tax=Catalinimonas niigatensis TaxID=1397264 RepID=UPI0026651178|nr:GWxTD domain-containing protein [Catalinimonas niigatensis]WPP51010.1 GWxTD domain-containing protein [Catalinimonas niigatensis]
MARTILFLATSLWIQSIFSIAFAQNNRESKNLDKFNVAYQYDQNVPMYCQYRVAVGTAEATVFLKVSQQSNEVGLNQIYYEVRPDYEKGDILQSGELTNSQQVKAENNVSYYRFTIPITEESDYVFIFLEGSFQGSELSYRYDIPLNNELNFPLTDLLLMEENEEIPIFESYLPQDKAFRLVAFYHQDASQVFTYYYNHTFEPNPPPMAGASADVQKSLQIDSIFPVQLNQSISFEQEGLYFAQIDTTSLSGISFRITDKYYPRLVRAQELIEPLRYISTSDEMDAMTEQEDYKPALDRYWMKVTRSQERAKEVISNYYRQVSNANQLFTTYKEGWKTGQGMVYLLYGPPDEVYRNAGEERWIYNEESNLLESLSFTFVKVRNIFTNKHYNLIRDEDYRRFWYRNIDLWRKGRKQI